ncbi:TetR/AcrR family transcriptional regulator [Erythrobacteraceae bacterium CFH 75059]|uniref:TetR/AcrR family transcriptional regulator n=1 Tax=Qipengyuania thermophila TaxID=2509361 RepID=UPI0010228A6A|nr:TetR/AcrR family transcriptional regulator [Qipengyuania thermophila]TCD04356.1 TetR/AcrR family transcriptional regulator [Erythrobacteraceae bacterium CFH 75059]
MDGAAAEVIKGRQPRTRRGARTRARLLDAAAAEFGEKGFHDASISGITSRAGTALGTFYTYFGSKEELFRTLVQDLSERVKERAGAALRPEMDAFATERAALESFLMFAREHKVIYRIIDEAEFVDPDSYRTHYERTARRILDRLQQGAAAGAVRADVEDVHAWAVMGMNVFLGLRFAIWSDDRPLDEVAWTASRLLRDGLRRR